MMACQSQYEECRRAQESGRVQSVRQEYVEWIRSLATLGEAIAELDDVIAIFDPNTRETIVRYICRENIESAAHGFLEGASTALGQPMEVDIEGVELSSQFTTALERLNEFIRTNFKAEEIHAALKSRWR
jgi:hypothetical protein